MQAERNGNGGLLGASPSPMSSTANGNPATLDSAQPTGQGEEAGPLSAVELQLVARLIQAGALSVVAVRDEVRITTPAGVDWKLGPAQWLLVQLPLGGRLPDGAIHRAERAKA